MRDFKKLTAVFGGLVASGALVSLTLMACSDDTSVEANGDGSVVPVPEASADPAPPVTDGGADAPTDAPALPELPPAINTAICTRILTCCGNGGGVNAPAFDGGVFDMEFCTKFYGGVGWD